MLFDLDGVLVDSAAAHREAWRQLGREVGVPFSDELFARTFGQRNESIVPTWLGRDVPPARIAALAERKETLYRAAVRRGAVRVFEGVPDVLERLGCAGAVVAIVSSGPRANVMLLVEVMGIAERVATLVAGEDVRAGKPDPECFLLAAARLGVPAAACAVVEDSVHGIEAARRAGMLAVAVLTSASREALPRRERICSSPLSARSTSGRCARVSAVLGGIEGSPRGGGAGPRVRRAGGVVRRAAQMPGSRGSRTGAKERRWTGQGPRRARAARCSAVP